MPSLSLSSESHRKVTAFRAYASLYAQVHLAEGDGVKVIETEFNGHRFRSRTDGKMPSIQTATRRGYEASKAARFEHNEKPVPFNPRTR
jgi:hypothetical protein